jgi:hypothetical protein
MPSCPWGSRGAAREADLWDFCGARRRPSPAHVAGHSETWHSSLRWQVPAAKPAWLPAVDSAGELGSRPRLISGTPYRERQLTRPTASGVGHDAVVGAAGAGAAGARAVAAKHLRGGPAVEFHQISLGAVAVQPGVAEVVPEPVRVGVHSALAAAACDQLVDPGGGQRLPAARAQPQLRPPGLRVRGAGADV